MPLLFGIVASIQKSLTNASTIRCVPSLVALAQHQTEYLPVLVGIPSNHIRTDFHAYHLVQKASSNTTHFLYNTRQPQLLPMDTLPPVGRFTKKLFTCGIPSTMSTIRGKMRGAKPAPPVQFGGTRSTSPLVDLIPRKAWVTLNRLGTGIGKCNVLMSQWGFCDSAAYSCGAEEQTMDPIIKYPLPNGMEGIRSLDEQTISWLMYDAPSI